MLYRATGEPFAIGRTTYDDTDFSNFEQHNAIFLEVGLSIEKDINIQALVDTGAPYCLFNNEIVTRLGWDYSAGEPAELSTRVGRFSDTIQRLPIIIAPEEGESLQIEASVFLSAQWHFGNFLGYSGFLERFRFALEPATNSFFFGPSE